MENRIRSILKSITWRLTATLTTMVLVFVFTKEIETTIQVGSIELLAKMLLYYFHERIWNLFKFGRE